MSSSFTKLEFNSLLLPESVTLKKQVPEGGWRQQGHVTRNSDYTAPQFSTFATFPSVQFLPRVCCKDTYEQDLILNWSNNIIASMPCRLQC